MWKKFLYISLLGFFCACTTMNLTDHKTGAISLIEDINKGKIKELNACSNVPFLFDKEILLRKADVSLLWENLKQADFTIEDPVVTAIENINPDSYKEFSHSMEVKVFFNKYVSKDCMLIRIKSKSGGIIFIAESKPGEKLLISAFTGK